MFRPNVAVIRFSSESMLVVLYRFGMGMSRWWLLCYWLIPRLLFIYTQRGWLILEVFPDVCSSFAGSVSVKRCPADGHKQQMMMSKAAVTFLLSVCGTRQPDNKAAELSVLTDSADCWMLLTIRLLRCRGRSRAVMKGGDSPEAILQHAN